MMMLSVESVDQENERQSTTGSGSEAMVDGAQTGTEDKMAG
jgi:hypothetical protein